MPRVRYDTEICVRQPTSHVHCAIINRAKDKTYSSDGDISKPLKPICLSLELRMFTAMTIASADDRLLRILSSCGDELVLKREHLREDVSEQPVQRYVLLDVHSVSAYT